MNNWKAGLPCSFGLKEVSAKTKNGLTKIEGQTPEEVQSKVVENRGHLVIFHNELDAHHHLETNIWDQEHEIVIFCRPFMEETPVQKGIVA